MCFRQTVPSEGFSLSERETLATYLKVPEEPIVYTHAATTVMFPEGMDQVTHNPDLAFLGRVLFYERALSADGTISCASCHQQSHAFGDDIRFSKGIGGIETRRNTLALGAYPSLETVYLSGGLTSAEPDSLSGEYRGIFWDERTIYMLGQLERSFADPEGMGILVSSIPGRLSGLEYYPILFRKAFGEEEITATRVMLALMGFLGTIVNVEAPFDDAFARTFTQGGDLSGDFDSFSSQQNLGKQLFATHCSACHLVVTNIHLNPILGNGKPRACNGLDMTYTDQGVGEYWGKPELNGVFKIPGLRNITATAPYMHDGRFGSLEAVIQHYNNGIQPHANLDSLLKDEQGFPKQLQLSEQEVDALLEFLRSLTNEHLLFDEKWSDPFLR